MDTNEIKSGVTVINPNNKVVYVIESMIGEGSFGEVWLAHKKGRESEKIAIKFYIPLDESGRRLFLEEYRSSADLHHPNLLSSLFYGEWYKHPYIGMPYCSNGSSSKYVGTLSPCTKDEALIWRFIRDTAAGLQYMHENEELVHQDIKPDNILIDAEGNFQIMDFGISMKARSTLRSQSKRSNSAGAPAYMAPERFTRQPLVIFASDVWSLGASIYELATGELPFNGMGGGLQNAGAEIPNLNDGWSKDLTKVMHSCLSKETWDRKRACDIKKYAEWVIGGKTGKNPWKESRSPKKMSARIKVILAMSVICIMSIVLFSMFHKSPEKKAAESAYPSYELAVQECQDSIEVGNNANTSALLYAKKAIINIKNLESTHKKVMPNEYSEYKSLQIELNKKLKEASKVWAETAKKQYDITKDFDLAIQFAEIALNLDANDESKKIYNEISSKVGYMKIKDIDFKADEGDYNGPLDASTIKYLYPRISYDGMTTKEKSIKLDIKIIEPNGAICQGQSSPREYTYSNNVNVLPGNNKVCYLEGWGSTFGGTYVIGVYFFEVWYKGNKLFTKRFKIE